MLVVAVAITVAVCAWRCGWDCYGEQGRVGWLRRYGGIVVKARDKVFAGVSLEQMQDIFLQVGADGARVGCGVHHLEIEFGAEAVEFREQRGLIAAEAVEHIVSGV